METAKGKFIQATLYKMKYARHAVICVWYSGMDTYYDGATGQSG